MFIFFLIINIILLLWIINHEKMLVCAGSSIFSSLAQNVI